MENITEELQRLMEQSIDSYHEKFDEVWGWCFGKTVTYFGEEYIVIGVTECPRLRGTKVRVEPHFIIANGFFDKSIVVGVRDVVECLSR